MKNLKLAAISLVTLAVAAGCAQGVDGAALLETGDLGYNTTLVGRTVQRESLIMEHFSGGDVAEELQALCADFADSFGVDGDAAWLAHCENPDYVWDTYEDVWVAYPGSN